MAAAAVRLAGQATAEATKAFAEGCQKALGLHAGAYRQLPSGLTISSVGVGTYQGPLGQESDDQVVEAIVQAVQGGVNVIDTAVNYRLQQGERCVGRALQKLLGPDATGGLSREALFISTKAGFVPGDYRVTEDKEEGMKKTAAALVESGVPVEEICDGFKHCLHPKALDILLAKSLDNLGIDTVDLLYLHNAENQKGMGVSHEELMRRIGAAFVWCERMCTAGKIRSYGLATWDCFHVGPEGGSFLSLEAVAGLARAAALEVSGSEAAAPRLAAMQIPINIAKPMALRNNTQTRGADTCPSLTWCEAEGLVVYASSSLGGGEVPALAATCEQHASVANRPAGAARWLEFTRSCPGVSCALVGMKRPANVAVNLELLKKPRLESKAFEALSGALFAATASST